MTFGELSTRWTVRVALALYAATLAVRLAAPGKRHAARALYTAGCLAFLLHVAAAFHFFHGWSHAHAYAETARQTRERVGVDWGGGLYLNDLFALLWVADAAYAWVAGVEAYEGRRRALGVALNAFFLFMAFNGAVVFAAGPTRWASMAVFVALGLLAASRLRRSRRSGAGGTD